MPRSRKETAILPERDPCEYRADCTLCPRLAAFLAQAKRSYPDYWCRPVPPFGDANARLVIVGLAPGLHGANASGRPFTGDHAGILLYRTLYEYGYGSLPVSRDRDDGLVLSDCRITNAAKCVPPENKPLPVEVATCNRYLRAELATLPSKAAVLALGRIAHDAALFALGQRRSAFAFAHGAAHRLRENVVLFDSYHCSRYNTNTGRLTPRMFTEVFDAIAAHLGRAGRH
jgi:uracil-DNA glycosylase family 4